MLQDFVSLIMTGKLWQIYLADMSTYTRLQFRFPGSQPVSFSVRDLSRLEGQERVFIRNIPNMAFTYSYAFVAFGSAKSLTAFASCCWSWPILLRVSRPLILQVHSQLFFWFARMLT